MKETKYKIYVMLAHVNGLPIERSFNGQWIPCKHTQWDWVCNNYRVKPAEQQQQRCKSSVVEQTVVF